MIEVRRSIRIGSLRVRPNTARSDLGLEEVRGGEPNRTHSEVVERFDETLGVGRVDEDPDVEVLRCPRMAVSSDGVAADDQETDLTSDAALDELDEVLSQSHRRIPN